MSHAVSCIRPGRPAPQPGRWPSLPPTASALPGWVPRDALGPPNALGRNVGFGAACNRGVAAVQEPVTVVLNPDVELLDDSLLLLAAEAMRADRPERLLAPLVLSPDGSRQDTVHPLPTSGADL